MDYVSFYALLSAVTALSSLYVVYVVLYYILLTRHRSVFEKYGFSPPKNTADWYTAQIYTVLCAVAINAMYIAYMVHIGIGASLISWMAWMCVTELAFVYILRKEKRHLK